MADNTITLTIFVNTDEKRIHLYSQEETGANNYVTANYNSAAIDSGFFEEFTKILTLYKQKFPEPAVTNVSIVLPDNFFLTDMLTIPNMGKRAIENSLKLVIGTTYKNRLELSYNTFPLSQNKQTAIYGMVGSRREILRNFRTACTNCGINVQNITFAANSMANGAMAINQKLKTSNCLILDIKENSARFAFLNKGRTLGAYNLPFGYSILSDSQLVAEDRLFDYSGAEQLIQTANEKARTNRRILADREEITLSNADEMVEKTTRRKLPKSMLRETPTNSEGFIYENFRIFVKWTLNLIASNTKITDLGEIEAVYVNMPSKYKFLFDTINVEKRENKATFEPLSNEGTPSKPLELLGGFYVKQYNKTNNF